MTLERGVLLRNRYRIVEILGQGGMGSVYRAVDENLGVDVAVKENLFTTEEYARQFRLEAVILANLRHPNLTRVTDHFVIGDQGQYLVMDYIEGEDLRQRMERTATLPEEEVILMGAAVCKALSYLHSRKPPILHRDVKPGNVKITSEGEVFLVDFGLAKVVKGSEITTTGARAMTPGYSPPEQYGTARTDPRTDVYSLGATLYAALTGIIPEDGLARAMENATLTPIRKRNPKISRRLASVVEKAMEVDTDDRYQTADEFRKALLASNSKTQRLSEGDFTVAPPPSEPLSPPAGDEVPDDGQDAGEEVPSVGIPITGQRTSPITSSKPMSKKRRKARTKLVRWLIFLALIAGGVSAAIFYPNQIKTQLAGWGILPLAASPSPVPSATPIEVVATETMPVVEEATETPTPEPSPTDTPEPTLTPTPENTPTPTQTPVGGSSGQIAFVSDRTGAPQIYLINSDGSNEHPVTNIPDGACQPDWSPDGKKLVFVSPCKTDQGDFKGSSLYVIDAEGTNLIQLPTFPGGGDFDPAWSPDGKRIAFTSLRDDFMQIYAISLDDNSVTRLTTDEKNKLLHARQPAWSPFGDQIAYSVQRYSIYQIWVMSDTGEANERLTVSGDTVWDMNPVWSPDGAVILYDQFSPTRPLNVWLMSIRYENRGTSGINMGIAPPVQDVDYSPDGFWLVFEGEEDDDNRDIFLMTASGASRTRLTSDPANDFDPVWHP